MIILTFDIDWAPEEVIADFLDLISPYPNTVTIFATHKSRVLDSIRSSKNIEIGLHPNFNTLMEAGSPKNAIQVLEQIQQLYPEAVGVRSHSRTVSAVLLKIFADARLCYDANQIIPYQPYLNPYKYNGFVRFTDYWQDDVHLLTGRSFNVDDLELEKPGLKIFDFHPIHIYLNTENLDRYTASKSYLNDMKTLKTYRNDPGKPGVRTFFIQLLENIERNKIKSPGLGALANQLKAKK